jgi:endonuclease-3 related protein
MKDKLMSIYKSLFQAYGEQHWWPAETFDEIIVGTILTQNTSWTNVERAIANLKRARLCHLDKIAKSSPEKIAELIKPSGYFNQKSKRLILVANEILAMNIQDDELYTARAKLLSVNGIGPETADSILLYAYNKPIFVIDAYTRRVFSRIDVGLEDYTYESLQGLFMNNLKHDSQLFNEYHALIVRHCKISCKKRPECEACCLSNSKEKGQTQRSAPYEGSIICLGLESHF